ncbi:MAG: MarR family transcriptional regulator [Bacteroidales bacterium]|nr:MarR family transcriptional regulator [Bacteroidales bacterium]
MESTNILDLIDQLKRKCEVNDDELMNEHQLTLAEFNFFQIYKANQVLSCESLANQMNLSLSRVSRVVDKLVVDGFLNRKQNSIDKRAVRLSITEKGLKMHHKIRNNRIECEKNIRQKLRPEESKELESSLNHLISLI